MPRGKKKDKNKHKDKGKASGGIAGAAQAKASPDKPLSPNQELLYKQLRAHIMAARSARTSPAYIAALKVIEAEWCNPVPPEKRTAEEPINDPNKIVVINCRKKPKQENLLTALCLHFLESYQSRTENDLRALLHLIDRLVDSGVNIFAHDATGVMLRFRFAVEKDKTQESSQTHPAQFNQLNQILNHIISFLGPHNARLSDEAGGCLADDQRPLDTDHRCFFMFHKAPLNGTFFYICSSDEDAIHFAFKVQLSSQGKIESLVPYDGDFKAALDATRRANRYERLDGSDSKFQDIEGFKDTIYRLYYTLHQSNSTITIDVANDLEACEVLNEAIALSAKDAAISFDPTLRQIHYPQTSHDTFIQFFKEAITRVEQRRAEEDAQLQRLFDEFKPKGEAEATQGMLGKSMGDMFGKHGHPGGDGGAPAPPV